MSTDSTSSDVEHSELPKVWISYDHGPVEDGATFFDEGLYVRDDALPFDVENSAGTVFDMDNITCTLLGDLGGHAVYRRQGTSTLYAMNWPDFAEAVRLGDIDLLNH